MINYTKKVALITGASRGIGHEIAKLLIKENIHVLALARTIGALEELDDYAKKYNNHITIIPCDLTQHEQIDILGYNIFKKFGKLDFLIGNAAMIGEATPVNFYNPDIWQKVLALNLTANYRLLRSLDPLLKKSLQAKILFFTEDLAKSSQPFFSAYNASKSGLQSLINTYINENLNSQIQAKILNLKPTSTKLKKKFFSDEILNDYQPATYAAQFILQHLIKDHANNYQEIYQN